MDYTPEISGLNGSIQFVVDVTDSDLNPFPGASFTKGYLTYNGALIKNPALRGNTVLWNAYPYNCSNSHCRLNYSATHPQNCSTRSSTVGSTLRFTEPGEVHIRLAWGLAPYAPVQGVKVLDSCTYSVVEPITCYQGQGSISSTSGGCGGDFFSVTCRLRARCVKMLTYLLHMTGMPFALAEISNVESTVLGRTRLASRILDGCAPSSRPFAARRT